MGLFPKDRNLAQPPDRVELRVRASDFGVRSEEVSLRLDAFLARHLSWRSRSSIQRLIKDGFVQVGRADPSLGGPGSLEPGEERRAGVRLRDGARVVVLIPPELRLPAPDPGESELRVLYEDDEVIAVDKPPLLPVHPSGRHLSDTLIQRVHARYRGLADERSRLPIRLCHRLDRETSGIVLCGKTEAAHAALGRQFEDRRVEKEYLAIVEGVPREDAGTVDRPLGPDSRSAVRLKIAVRPDGLPSRTAWRVLERRRGHALVACVPETGRQHQIRVHLAALGHPVVGDKLYGPDESSFLRAAAGELTDADRTRLRLERHALHNHRLAWTSHEAGVRREVVSPLAQDLRAFFAGLGVA